MEINNFLEPKLSLVKKWVDSSKAVAKVYELENFIGEIRALLISPGEEINEPNSSIANEIALYERFPIEIIFTEFFHLSFRLAQDFISKTSVGYVHFTRILQRV